MKYLKLTENQKQIIEFKNAQNSAVNVPRYTFHVVFYAGPLCLFSFLVNFSFKNAFSF